LCKALHTPFLYDKLMIKSKSTIFQSINVSEKFTKFINMATHLKVISLKHCSTFNREVLNILNNNCNPFVLSELYLDGCEGVNDQCFDCLMLTKEEIALENLNHKLSSKEGDENIEAAENLSTFVNQNLAEEQKI